MDQVATTDSPGHGPPLFRDRSRSAQLALGGLAPAAIGALAGVLLGVSSVAYAAVALIAAVGAFLSGLEHPNAWGGADRGFASGVIYGVALLAAHALAGTQATVSLGSFAPGLIVVTALVGMLLAAAGATRPPAMERS